jgi:hypothetical protein
MDIVHEDKITADQGGEQGNNGEKEKDRSRSWKESPVWMNQRGGIIANC